MLAVSPRVVGQTEHGSVIERSFRAKPVRLAMRLACPAGSGSGVGSGGPLEASIVEDIVRKAFIAASLVSLLPSAALAQYLPPNELSVALGVLRDQSLSQSDPAGVVALSWDWDEMWRAAFIVEGELGATSAAEPCRERSADPPENCYDAMVLAGLRFRRVPHVSSGIRPFVSVLLGQYWKGSGQEDREFISSHLAVQTGVGAEMRWPNSIQGLRVSLDYRHVLAVRSGRNQIRLMFGYVIGPRRFKLPPGP
jgi:hypothetical protein